MRARRAGWILMTVGGLSFAVTNVSFFFDSFPGGLPGQAEIYLDNALVYLNNALVLRVHIVAGSLALLVGPMQFWSGFRDRHRKWHRRLGKIYLTCVAIGSPTALYVAWISYGGLPTHISFTLLALVWGGTTLMAYRRIRARNWRSHREWMIRSYSCVLGILAMRGWVGVFIPDFPNELQFDDAHGRFCYKNQCIIIITPGEARVTRRVNPGPPIYGSISTVASSLNSMVPRLRQTLDCSPTGSLTMPLA